MRDYWDITFDLLGQFTGGRSSIDHTIVPFGLAAIFWIILIGLSLVRQSQGNFPHERILLWGFSIGLVRELIMLIITSLQAYGLVDSAQLQIFFPPFEHMLRNIAEVTVAAGFLRYMLENQKLSLRYLKTGVGIIVLCYLLTFLWWGNFISANPEARFEQTWADWVFRVTASGLILYPIVLLLVKTAGKTRALICSALFLFFLTEFLKMPEIAPSEVYESIFAPIRHAFYILAIPLFGIVYLWEIARERASFYARITQTVADKTLQLNRLKVIHSVGTAITSSTELIPTIEHLLIEIRAQLKINAATVLLYEKETMKLECIARKGFRSHSLKYPNLSIEDSNAGYAARKQRILAIPDITRPTDNFISSEFLLGEGFVSYFAVPLVVKEETLGVMELLHRSPVSTDQEWLDFVKILANEAAIAIDNALLFERLEQSNRKLAAAYDTTIEGWARALDMRDKEAEGHSRRVMDLTVRIARKFNMNDDEIEHIRRGALLHDIGKMGIPDHILSKPGKLTGEEWEIMKRHTEFGRDLLTPIEYLKPAIDIPYLHHEKVDGTGYPLGLKGTSIPLAARIFAVVDIWDALRTDRPYKAAWSMEKIKEYIRSIAGTHLDPEIVKVFLSMDGLTDETDAAEVIPGGKNRFSNKLAEA